MPSKTVLFAIAAVIVGFVIGVIARSADDKNYDAAIAALEARVDGLSAGVDEIQSGMSESFAAVESGISERIGAVEAGVSAGAQALSEATGALRGEMAAMGEATRAALAEAQAAAQDAVTAGLAAMSPAETLEAAPETMPEAATEATMEAATEATTEAVADAPVYRAGQTVMLADGALRVFVSRVDDGEGRVSLAVNGFERVMLGQGRATEVRGGDGAACLLSVGEVSADGVALAAPCGADRAEPRGVTAGSTARLTDGLRVFVSRVSDGAARIAINGRSLQSLSVGEAADVPGQRCALRLEGIDRGHVDVSTTCG
ncbi:hypothetical protein [Poseidonocella sedimentorum]|uniref:Uncharacterized protein n=1 Tax=Poseidonocella sedimentorum TaxID=871652 RepID=A0A1I6DDN1_9RHOB|nr:hypothetical protein [Poseidonocella sedimentorum]SFR03553.1 hypothetical protein SAMN04515673_10334 [Poseidonocella sedimentorum]